MLSGRWEWVHPLAQADRFQRFGAMDGNPKFTLTIRTQLWALWVIWRKDQLMGIHYGNMSNFTFFSNGS